MLAWLEPWSTVRLYQVHAKFAVCFPLLQTLGNVSDSSMLQVLYCMTMFELFIKCCVMTGMLVMKAHVL